MKVHITNLYGFARYSPAVIAPHNVVKVASEFINNVGMELGVYNYPIDVDSDSELSSRQDGIIASLLPDDIVIFQVPTWNKLKFEERLIDKFKAYKTTLIIFVHDVAPLQFDSGEENLKRVIDMYNHADVLILPSKEMHERLKRDGLKVQSVCYQKLWDQYLEVEFEHHDYIKRMVFTGAPTRFPFLNSYQGKTPIELFTYEASDESANVIFKGVKEDIELLAEVSKGGFGLVWAVDQQYEYYKMNQPYKVATFLTAGIPLIVRRGVHVADYVEEHHIGFVVDTLEEADEIVQKITVEEYNQLLENVKKIQFLVTNGYYTRQVLNEAIMMAMEKSTQ